MDGGSVDARGACNIFILGGLVAAAASAADVVTGVTETLEARGFDCVIVAVFCCLDEGLDGGSVTADDAGDARNIPLFFLFLDDGSVAAAAAADLVAGIVTGAARSGAVVAPTAGALA